ncbi:MAG TPA: aspartate/glutamate racemase family protein, partial [Chloroflexota bacterium]
MKRVVLIHTVASLPTTFDQLAAELLPGVEVEHVVDEALLQETMRAGGLTDGVRARFADDARRALATAPDAVVLTCSSVGPAADGLDVHRIDQAMAERAVELGARIGVAATVPTTLGPTSELIERAAGAAGRPVEVRTRLVEGAFDALRGGQPEEHDRLVMAALRELAAWAEVVVLAQASMARALAGASQVGGVPVLTSPRLGVER